MVIRPKNSNEKTTLTEVAYERIVDWIMGDELKPGDPLTEGTLAKRLNISRTPIREALRRLEREDLVVIVPHTGAFVARMNLKDLHDFFEVREATECMVARLAAERGDVNEFRKIKKLILAAQKERNGSKRHEFYEEAGRRLHSYIMKASDNTRFYRLAETFRVQIYQEKKIALKIPGRIEKSKQEHLRILNALILKDPDKAERMMRQHLRSTRNSVLKTYPSLNL